MGVTGKVLRLKTRAGLRYIRVVLESAGSSNAQFESTFFFFSFLFLYLFFFNLSVFFSVLLPVAFFFKINSCFVFFFSSFFSFHSFTPLFFSFLLSVFSVLASLSPFSTHLRTSSHSSVPIFIQFSFSHHHSFFSFSIHQYRLSNLQKERKRGRR